MPSVPQVRATQVVRHGTAHCGTPGTLPRVAMLPVTPLSPQGHSCSAPARATATTASAPPVPLAPSAPSPTPSPSAKLATSATTKVSWRRATSRHAMLHGAVLCHAAPCCATHCPSPAAFQSVLSNCSATSNVACGCKPGHFRDCLDERCSDFSCRQCQPCTGRLIQRPCECCRPARGMSPPAVPLPAAPPCLTPALSPGSEAQDTLCGSCKPDFYAEGGECRPCHM